MCRDAQPLQLRPASPADWPAVARLAAQVHQLHQQNRPDVYLPGDPLPRERYLSLLQDGATALLLACRGDRVLGYALLCIRTAAPLATVAPSRFCYMDDLCVDKEARGAGAGRALFSAACSWARQRGAQSLQLTVWEFNKTALAFYERMGMTTRNRRLELPL